MYLFILSTPILTPEFDESILDLRLEYRDKDLTLKSTLELSIQPYMGPKNGYCLSQETVRSYPNLIGHLERSLDLNRVATSIISFIERAKEHNKEPLLVIGENPTYLIEELKHLMNLNHVFGKNTQMSVDVKSLFCALATPAAIKRNKGYNAIHLARALGLPSGFLTESLENRAKACADIISRARTGIGTKE
jgi:hypothetical protein